MIYEVIMPSLDVSYLLNSILSSTKTWRASSSHEYHTSALQVALLASALLLLILTVLHFSTPRDDLPIVNRRFRLEPRIFARIRWATHSRDILKAANEKVDMTHFFILI